MQEGSYVVTEMIDFNSKRVENMIVRVEDAGSCICSFSYDGF